MTQVPSRSWADASEAVLSEKKAVPEGLWLACPECREPLFRKAVEGNLWVCTVAKCQYHFRVSAAQRVKQLAEGAGDFLLTATLYHFAGARRIGPTARGCCCRDPSAQPDRGCRT